MTDDAAKRKEEVLEVLKQIMDPDLGRNIVDLDFVKDLEIQDGKVSFKLELTTPACPMREQFQTRADELVSGLEWVDDVKVELSARVRGKPTPSAVQPIPGVKNMIAVASGKGGVGKSTIAANLAIALQQTGARVGILDADVYGPSVPTMFALHESPTINGEGEESRVIPLEKFGIKLMSMGLLAGGDTPVIWRGPMVHSLLTQFLTHVDWGDLDYLVVDFPPGTGDAQLTMTQAPLSGVVIVTTPQQVSLLDARKGLHMFRKVKIDVLGIVENMSYFACPHCGERTSIFREGGGETASRELGVPLLGQIPIDPEISLSSDEGVPIILRNPSSEVSEAYRELAGKVAAELSTKAVAAESTGGNTADSPS
jgi:ATP-binding protein involved in chromosome partitioning